MNMIKNQLGILKILVLGVILLLTTGCATISTSGDYTLESGRTLRSNLVITSGDSTLEEGSRVTGNVLMTSGHLQVDGEVDGNVVMFSGNVSIGPEGIVHGDIRGTSGTVQQDGQTSQVEGQIELEQSTFTIGAGFFASLFGLICGLPLAVIGAVIFLVVAFRRGRIPDEPLEPAAGEGSAQKLKELKQMLDDGLITDDEYEAKKAELLAGM